MVRSLLQIFARRPARPEPFKPAVVAPAAVANLEVAAVAETEPAMGLIVVELVARMDPPGEAVLQVALPGAPVFEKPVSLTAQDQPFWVAVHGHLLPNGPTPVRVTLADAGGRALAARERTLLVRNEGPLAAATAASLRRSGAPMVVDLCDASLYDYADDSLAAWHDQGPEAVEAHLAGLTASGAATAAEIAALRHFVENGYMVLPDVIPPEEVARLNAALDDAVEKKVEGYEWGASQRLHNLHLTYPAIRELWVNPTVLHMLGLVFGSPAKPYQSLTYVFGSEQFHHQDTIVLTPFPAGRMCGVWTALEDIQPDSGELVVYPKSHRLPRTYMKDLDIAKVAQDWTDFGEAVAPVWTGFLKNRFAPEIYRPRAGTVLIWHENLMHGGRVRRDKEKSRRSIVGHYFAEGCIAYHDASGMPGVLKNP
jgi:hypothetical protein